VSAAFGMVSRVGTDILGHERWGSGKQNVVVLNDWMSDTSSWDGARQYMDRDRFTWVFADLRGYGRSRGRAGSFTVLEAASDVLALADALPAPRFAIVGHSMSTLVAVHLAQHTPDRIERAVLLCPPPPAGFSVTEQQADASRALARSDAAARAAALSQRFEPRLSKGWSAFKAARWSATSDPDAAAGYVSMFGRDGVPHARARVEVPVLAITGEHDAPPMRREAVVTGLSPICDKLEVVSLADSGHYPMQEMPPLTVALLEHFLGQ
jgi:3-oxoadipate enol-lactonase